MRFKIILLSILPLAYARNIIYKSHRQSISGNINDESTSTTSITDQKPLNDHDTNRESLKQDFKSITDITHDVNESMTKEGDLNTENNVYKNVTESYLIMDYSRNTDAGSTTDQVKPTTVTVNELDIIRCLILMSRNPASPLVYVAFDGDSCPKGMVKFQNMCVYPDKWYTSSTTVIYLPKKY